MHVHPISPPVQHGHNHKTNNTTEAPRVATANIGSTDDAVAGGAVMTEEVQAVSTGSLSAPLTPETAFNTHVIGSEGHSEGNEGSDHVESGDNSGPGNSHSVHQEGHHRGHSDGSPAHIARQLIAEGLTGSAASLAVSTEGGHQPFGQIVAQIVKAVLAELNIPAPVASGKTDGTEVPAEGGIIAPQEPGSVEGALLDALDDATGEPAAADGTGVVEAVPAGDDAASVADTGAIAVDIPVAAVDDGLLTEALLDMLNDEGVDGEADAAPVPVTDTTGEEIV